MGWWWRWDTRSEERELQLQQQRKCNGQGVERLPQETRQERDTTFGFLNQRENCRPWYGADFQHEMEDIRRFQRRTQRNSQVLPPLCSRLPWVTFCNIELYREQGALNLAGDVAHQFRQVST